MKRINVLFLLVVLSVFNLFGQDKNFQKPFIGAQIFIEPGQSAEKIDNYFKLLADNHMPLCRIRMFESYMKKEDGSWDFSLFDRAFKAADKYQVKIYGTLFPYTEKTDIGGFKFPYDDDHLESIAEFIKQAVTHFSQYESLFGWVLINEPGAGKVPDTPFTQKKYQEWLIKNQPKDYTENGYPVLVELDKDRFLKDYNTWYLSWLAKEVKKYDQTNDIHVNSHAIFGNIAEYDFPSWRKFLGTLGGSAHPSWHFTYFDRDQYALAMSANSEIIRSGAGNLPWIMTEIQAGNNTYSGVAPFCPTADEITQWLWTVVGTEGKGSIFWSLNPRASGIEAGEWAMVTFDDTPSDRLIAAGNVAKTIDENSSLFSMATELNSGINILYVQESLWAENAMAMSSKQNYEGRKKGAVIKSAISYFKAITEMGLNCNLKGLHEFDFSKEDYSGEVIILANQLSLPASIAPKLENFVSKGGKLIVDGLTAFFDENLQNILETGFYYKSLFGGHISEYKAVDNLFNTELDGEKIPSHLWRGNITVDSGEKIAGDAENCYAVRNKFGKGEVVWVPSLMGLGAWVSKDYTALTDWLVMELNVENQLISFEEPISGMIMKTLQSGSSFITVIINKSGETKTVPIRFKNIGLKPRCMTSIENNSLINSDIITLQSEETVVIEWKK